MSLTTIAKVSAVYISVVVTVGLANLVADNYAPSGPSSIAGPIGYQQASLR